MSDALSFAEVEGQHVEVLPSRTVLSAINAIATLQGGDGLAGDGGDASATNTKGDVMQNTEGGAGTGGDGPLKGVLGQNVH